MILLSQYSPHMPKSAGSQYLKKMEEAVRLLGGTVINFEQGNIESLKQKLYYRRKVEKVEKIFWLGFVPTLEEYEVVYNMLKGNGLELIHTPAEFAKSEYFDQFYPYIKEDSIESGIATTLAEAKEIAHQLGYPVFVKGAIQSLKKFGWNNCIAHSTSELTDIFHHLKRKSDFSLGTIIIRKYVRLRHHEIAGNGIPKAHEYRFFVFREQIVDYSYYWNGANPFTLSTAELEELKAMVLKAAKRLNVPYISVDVGETVDSGWKVIEVGDGQFSDIRNISPLRLWNYLMVN